jgi:hypothetical protein
MFLLLFDVNMFFFNNFNKFFIQSKIIISNVFYFSRNIINLRLNKIIFRSYSDIKKTTSKDKVVKSKFILYRELKKMIESSHINSNTQLKIENYLFENDVTNLNKEFSNIYEFLGSVNKDFKKIFFEKRSILLELVINFKKRWLNVTLNEKELKQKGVLIIWVFF